MTHVHKFKCLNCGLHYTVYSWEERWPKGLPDDQEQSGYCPECGSTAKKLHWHEETQQQIYTFVPGPTQFFGFHPGKEGYANDTNE